MFLFAIYDAKAEGHKPVFSVNTVGEAERVFLDACGNKDIDLGKHPEDYALWCVGEFDVMSGEIEAKRFHICNGRGRELMLDSEPLIGV